MQLLQHLLGGPLQWPEDLYPPHTAAGQRSTQVAGPHFTLFVESASDPFRTSANARLPPHSSMVASSCWWRFSQGAQRPPLLPRTPGTACGLPRGNVTSPFHQSHLNWIHDPTPTQSHRLEPKNTVPRNTVTVNSSDPIPRNPLDPIPSASWNNSSLSAPSAPPPSSSVRSKIPSVPRNNSENEVSAIATRGSPPALLSSVPPKKRRTRRRRLARRAASRQEGNSSANHSAAVPAGVTQPHPETSDPTSARRTAVYPPSRIVGGSPTNENSPFQIGLESSEIPGLYKPAVPDQQQDTHARTFRANSSGSGTSSPPYLLPYTKPFSGWPAGSSMTSPKREAGETLRIGSGIVYPLQPRVRRPDTRITVDAALPEPATFQRQDLPPTVVDIGSPIQSQKSPAAKRRASRKPSRKRRCNCSTVVFQPAKRSPSRGHWCD